MVIDASAVQTVLMKIQAPNMLVYHHGDRLMMRSNARKLNTNA